jgi:uncharacterized protein YxeA
MKKTVVTLILVLLSLCVNSQMYRVLNIHSIEYMEDDSYEETELTSSDKMVIIGASYISLYQYRGNKSSRIASDTTYTFNNLSFEGITTIEDPILLECGFDEFEVYTADQRSNISHIGYNIVHDMTVLISIQRDDSNYKYLILKIEDTVFLHILIQRI